MYKYIHPCPVREREIGAGKTLERDTYHPYFGRCCLPLMCVEDEKIRVLDVSLKDTLIPVRDECRRVFPEKTSQFYRRLQ